MLRHSEQHGADEAVRASWRVRRDVFQLPQADRPHSSGAPSGAGAQTPPPSAAGYPEPDGFQPAQDDADSRDSRISPEPVRGAAERKADLDRRIAVPERHYPVHTPVFPHQQPGQPDAIPGRGTPRRVGRRAGNFAGRFRRGFCAVRCQHLRRGAELRSEHGAADEHVYSGRFDRAGCAGADIGRGGNGVVPDSRPISGDCRCVFWRRVAGREAQASACRQ